MDAVLNGRYRLLEKLGEGGAGSVFRAQNLLTGKQVAIKRLHPLLTAAAEASQRLLREAQAASSMCHPNIVDVYDVVSDANQLYLIMELLRGQTLRSYLKGEPRPALWELIQVLLPALDAVAAAHASGVIHRDLKPANIFLANVAGRTEPLVKVLDFGIAKLADVDGPTLTQTGVPLGTPMFMSLEQLCGDSGVDARTDVYAVGVMLYIAATGRAPYQAATLPELAIKMVTTDVVPVATLRPEMPATLAHLIDWAVARERADRLPDIPLLMRELEVFARAHSFRAQMADPGAQLPNVLSLMPVEEAELAWAARATTGLQLAPPPWSGSAAVGGGDARADATSLGVQERAASSPARHMKSARWLGSLGLAALIMAGVWVSQREWRPAEAHPPLSSTSVNALQAAPPALAQQKEASASPLSDISKMDVKDAPPGAAGLAQEAALAKGESLPSPAPQQATTDCSVSRYTRVNDDFRTLSFEVPEAWSTAWGNGWHRHYFPSLPTPLGPGMNASPNVREWFSVATRPGVFVGASAYLANMFDPEQVLARYSYEGCTRQSGSDLSLPYSSGRRVDWTCNAGYAWHFAAVWPADHAYVAVIQSKVLDTCDQQIFEHVLTTLSITPPRTWPKQLTAAHGGRSSGLSRSSR